jgi:hypothetical protein
MKRDGSVIKEKNLAAFKAMIKKQLNILQAFIRDLGVNKFFPFCTFHTQVDWFSLFLITEGRAHTLAHLLMGILVSMPIFKLPKVF